MIPSLPDSAGESWQFWRCWWVRFCRQAHIFWGAVFWDFLVAAVVPDRKVDRLGTAGLAVLRVAIELLQIPVSDRSFLWIDAGDSVAATIGIALPGLSHLLVR